MLDHAQLLATKFHIPPSRSDLVPRPRLITMLENGLNQPLMLISAPHKDLIWFNGGHGLGADNLDQFVDVMVNKVLVETYPAQ